MESVQQHSFKMNKNQQLRLVCLYQNKTTTNVNRSQLIKVKILTTQIWIRTKQRGYIQNWDVCWNTFTFRFSTRWRCSIQQSRVLSMLLCRHTTGVVKSGQHIKNYGYHYMISWYLLVLCVHVWVIAKTNKQLSDLKTSVSAFLLFPCKLGSFWKHGKDRNPLMKLSEPMHFISS